MRSPGLSALLLAAVSLPALAQTPAPAAPPASPDKFRTESAVFELSDTTYRMHADGTGERDMHIILRIQSEAAAREFSVLAFSYASDSESPRIAYVRVHKPTGVTIETPATDVIDMAAAVTREAPLYSDLKEKHIPVRSLSVGDTLEYEVDTIINKPEAAGQFWGAHHFIAPGSVIALSEVLRLELPAEKYVQVWSPNYKPAIAQHDGLITYTWNTAQLVPAPKDTQDDATKPDPPKDPDTDSDGRSVPSIAWTTFKSWADVGDWYRSLSTARLEPTDAVRARAAELTQGITNPEDQVRAIYNFVSTGTRYIGIDFGVGRYQPHAAADVLANQYGDCKDKDTLLEALLRSKGFSTSPALIGAGIALVPDVPTPAVFNHVITTVNLPSGRIWLDSTAEVAPYRMLNGIIRDVQALVVPPTGPATLERTPSDPPFALSEKFEADGSLDADGKFTAHIVSTYRSDNEVLVRSLARTVPPADIDKLSQYIAANTGFTGTTANTTITSPTDLSTPITLKYDYSRKIYGDWPNLRITPAFPAVELSGIDDAKAPVTDISLGSPRALSATSRITLPEGWHTDLPDPIHVKTAFATFDKTYRFDGKEIVVQRNITILSNKVAKADWKQYADFYKQTQFDSENWIQLIRPSAALAAKSTPAKNARPADPSATAATPAADANLSAEQLIRQAAQQLETNDITAATASLDLAKTKNPDEKLLWALYGSVADQQKKYDVAETDYKKELAAHPDNGFVVRALAFLQARTDQAKARATLQTFLTAHPEDVDLALYYSGLQVVAKDNAGALKTLQAASTRNPDNQQLTLQLAYALYRVGRNDEAIAAAKTSMDASEDPGLLNDGSYLLSKAGLDLTAAEEGSRKGIGIVEAKSAAISTDEVNSSAYAQASLLMASWDTLGWILFREEKLAEAKDWIMPAWRNDFSTEVGDHLGQIYEALKQPAEALTYYQLAQTASTGKIIEPETTDHINAAITRLKAAGVKPSAPTTAQALQDSRTYRISIPTGISGYGTFRLQISTAGVVAEQQVSGEKKLSAIADAVKAMKFPELIPPQSKAHLLRTAIISCSSKATCEVVLVPDSTLRNEQ